MDSEAWLEHLAVSSRTHTIDRGSYSTVVSESSSNEVLLVGNARKKVPKDWVNRYPPMVVVADALFALRSLLTANKCLFHILPAILILHMANTFNLNRIYNRVSNNSCLIVRRCWLHFIAAEDDEVEDMVGPRVFQGYSQVIYSHIANPFREERENSMVPTYSTGKMLASIVQRHRPTRYWYLVRKAEENSNIVKSRSMSVHCHPRFWSSGFSAVGLYAHHEAPSWMALRATCHR